MQVTIVQRILPEYRAPFFDRLAGVLRDRGGRLQVLHGQEQPGSVPRSVPVEAEWSIAVNIEHGQNGLVTANTLDGFVTGVCGLLSSPDLLARLRDGCAASAAGYTLDAMVARHADGIEECLASSCPGTTAANV